MFNFQRVCQAMQWQGCILHHVCAEGPNFEKADVISAPMELEWERISRVTRRSKVDLHGLADVNHETLKGRVELGENETWHASVDRSCRPGCRGKLSCTRGFNNWGNGLCTKTAGCQQRVFCFQFSTWTAPQGFALVPPTRLCACQGLTSEIASRVGLFCAVSLKVQWPFGRMFENVAGIFEAVTNSLPSCWMSGCLSGPLRDSDGTRFGHRGGKSARAGWLHCTAPCDFNRYPLVI